MARARTVATFETSAFNSTERREYFLREGAYGDDLAEWLIDELGARGVTTDAEPRQEESGGWCFGFHKNETEYTCLVTHRRAPGKGPHLWIVIIERKAGKIGSLLRADKRGIEPEAVQAIHSVLGSALLIHNLRWHFRRDFDAGNQERGQSDPLAS